MKPTKAELKQRTLDRKNEQYIKVCNCLGHIVHKAVILRWKLNNINNPLNKSLG